MRSVRIASHVRNGNPQGTFCYQCLRRNLNTPARPLIRLEAGAEIGRLPSRQFKVAGLRRPGRAEVKRQESIAADGLGHFLRVEHQARQARTDGAISYDVAHVVRDAGPHLACAGQRGRQIVDGGLRIAERLPRLQNAREHFLVPVAVAWPPPAAGAR